MSVVVFEPSLVVGECPFLACSKVLLSRAQERNPDWVAAVARRDEVTYGRDDASHAKELEESGATLVRARATVTGPGRIRADGIDYRVEHIVVATGAAPKKLPDIKCPDDVWDSSDAMSSDELPASLVIVGGGPIGCELSEVYSRFGTTVTIVEAGDTLLKEVEPEISRAMQHHLEGLGITVLMSAALSAITGADAGYLVHVRGRQPIPCARVLVAIGKTPRLDGIGLETLGLDPTDVMVDDAGRLGGVDRVWGVGDVTGLAPYTHGANSGIGGGRKHHRVHAVGPRCRDAPVRISQHQSNQDRSESRVPNGVSRVHSSLAASRGPPHVRTKIVVRWQRVRTEGSRYRDRPHDARRRIVSLEGTVSVWTHDLLACSTMNTPRSLATSSFSENRRDPLNT